MIPRSLLAFSSKSWESFLRSETREDVTDDEIMRYGESIRWQTKEQFRQVQIADATVVTRKQGVSLHLDSQDLRRRQLLLSILYYVILPKHSKANIYEPHLGCRSYKPNAERRAPSISGVSNGLHQLLKIRAHSKHISSQCNFQVKRLCYYTIYTV